MATALLVAVVVLVSSVVGVYVFGVADRVEDPPPQASFGFDWDVDSRTLTVSHEGGDAFTDGNSRRLLVEIRDEDDTGQNDYLLATRAWVGDDPGAAQAYPLEAGDEFVVTGEYGGGDIDVNRDGTDVGTPTDAAVGYNQTYEPEVGDRVRILWTNNDGDESLIVDEYTIPAGEDP